MLAMGKHNGKKVNLLVLKIQPSPKKEKEMKTANLG
jgi:hypothetical protein